MEIGDIIEYLLIVAIVVTVILIFTGKFLDLRVEKFTMDQTRAGINILQVITSDSPFLLKDLNNQPIKSKINKIIVPTLSSDVLQKCCDLLEYDYILTLKDLQDEGWSYTFKNFESSRSMFAFETMSSCYANVGFGYVDNIDSPINVCNDEYDCNLGKAILKITKSPLSDLTFWISKACSFNEDFIKLVPFDKSDLGTLEIDKINKKICTGVSGCKKYECDNELTERASSSNELKSSDPNCFYVKVSRENGKVYVTSPLESSIPQDNLPADRDSWTEDSTYLDNFKIFSQKPIVAGGGTNYGKIELVEKPAELPYSSKSVKFSINKPITSVVISLDLNKNLGLSDDFIDVNEYKKLSFYFKVEDKEGNDVYLIHKYSISLEDAEDPNKICTIVLDYPGHWTYESINLYEEIQKKLTGCTDFGHKIKTIYFLSASFTEGLNYYLDSLYFSR